LGTEINQSALRIAYQREDMIYTMSSCAFYLQILVCVVYFTDSWRQMTIQL